MSTEAVAEYYAALTDRYLRYAGPALAWHFGLWDEGVATVQAALLRSNEILVAGCELGPASRVLDAGCGIGGLGIYLAERYGAHVTGITVCEPHLELARRFAAERGVGELVEFRHCDFAALDFGDQAFDVVLNQETVCYAADKAAYLRGVRRVLRPGGRWRAVDGFLGPAPLDAAAEEHHRQAQAGWKIPPLERVATVAELVASAGFSEVMTRDLADLARPTAQALADQGLFHELLLRSGTTPDPLFDDHMRACAGFSQGLLDGAFVYALVGGTR